MKCPKLSLIIEKELNFALTAERNQRSNAPNLAGYSTFGRV